MAMRTPGPASSASMPCAGGRWAIACIPLVVVGCASAPGVSPSLASAPLVGVKGQSFDVRTLVADSTLTAFVFFSRECHCLAQHDDRLRDLYAAYHARGVAFVMVDSEVGADARIDAAEAEKRGYPFPILLDRRGVFADAVGAEYATYSVLVDRQGHVRYRGGIDSDKTHLTATSTPFLRNAIDDLLGGREPRLLEGKTLGCSLRKW